MADIYTKRDRYISRYTHRLFWKATLSDMPTFIAWLLTRPAALFVNNVLIPVAVAYGLQAIVTQNFDSVGHYAIILMGLAVLYGVLWGIGGIFICKNGKVGTMYIQRAIFSNYLRKDYEFYSDTYVGALGTQALKFKDTFNSYCQLLMNNVTKQVIIVVSSIVIIALQSLVLAGVTLTCMVLILSFTVATGRWRLKYRRALSVADSEMSGIIGDALSHGATVKSFASEGYEEKRLGNSLGKLANAQYWTWMTSIPADVGRMLLAAATTGILLIMTAHLYQQHAISIAIVALVQLYVIKLVSATQDISDLIKTYETIMSSAYQSVKTMLIEPTITDKDHPIKIKRTAAFDITFSDVSYGYDDANHTHKAVDNFSLHIDPGEKIGFVGYSGSGKTTLTKLLLRFMDVTGGSIKLAGIDIRDLSQQDLRDRIAYVPQEPLLFHRSIEENIAYGRPNANKKAVRAAAKAAYVDEFASDLPKGYDTHVGERGVKLSGGQRQRVAIARAILKDAPILVLDEATSALDSRSEKLIQSALWRLMKGRTALVVAHRLSTIQHLDRIVVLNKGSIEQIGTHEELLKQKRGTYAKLWTHQSGGYLGGVTKNIESSDEKL
jgi:ATP-binding cassette, subfamily B, bacterial